MFVSGGSVPCLLFLQMPQLLFDFGNRKIESRDDGGCFRRRDTVVSLFGRHLNFNGRVDPTFSGRR